ncbi:MAG: amidohydrolase [Spirochaetia bacterium]|jgi:predicted TIM-barrel fold metal-dependent hydrolase|nr:amidohydrolase [Spirochaetia bacterium]
MIIDFHTHIFQPEAGARAGEYLADKNFASLYSNPSARIVDADALFAAMTDSGIDAAAAMGFPWLTEKLCRGQNEYFAGVQRRFAGKIFCFGSIPLQCGASAALKGAAREIRAFGLAGIGEAAFYGGFDHSAQAYLHLLLEAAEETGLILCLHVNEPVGHAYPGKYEPSLGALYKVLVEHKAAAVVLAHWGGGLVFYELMPEVKEALGNVYYDSAASPYLYNEEIFAHAVSIAGPERILFGSDYPLLRFERYLEQIKNTVKDKKHYDAVCGGNAARLLKIEIVS